METYMEEQCKKCPECNSDRVLVVFEEVLTYQGKKLSYFCENCGWSIIFDHPFFIDTWDIKINQAIGPVDVLNSLLSNQDTTNFLISRMTGPSYLTTTAKDFLYSRFKQENKSYLNQYLRQNR